MKRIFLLGILLSIAFITIPVVAQTDLVGEHIRSYDTQITVGSTGYIAVTESIVYDFGQLERHGIYRTIPFEKTNDDGKRYRMDITDVLVTDENGTRYNFTTTNENGELKLKIGDPDRTISGVHTYVITYRVAGALTYFSDHDELYWNAIGTDWDVPIAQVATTVVLPETIQQDISTRCYIGVVGSTESCTSEAQGNRIVYTSSRALSSGEGMSVVTGFPIDVVARLEPTEVIPFSQTLFGKMVIFLVIIAVILWYVVYPLWLPIKWYLYGRDPQSARGKTVVSFDPPKGRNGLPLTPSETGAVIDEQVGMQEISALLINLAQRGYFKIVEKKKGEFELHKGKDIDLQVRAFEKILLQKLFGSKDVVKLKDSHLASTVETIQETLYQKLVDEGFFPKNPDSVRKYYSVISGIAAVTFNFFLLISASIFGRIMPRKTDAGVEAANVARSLKNFLTSQERQLEFQAQNQMMFEKLLPFAVAFGVEKIWAERFKDIALTQPEWFEGSYVGAFNARSFTRSLDSSMSSFRSAATPVRSSTGHSSGFSGGSSGGGGGGGGGGSW